MKPIFLIPAGEARAEIVIDRSRFIAMAAPVFSVEQARDFIRRVKTEFPDASHHVPAFLIGHGAGVTAHCSDDGEPSGTAGRPTLAVLQGSGFGDIVVVVTRYFGGIKLGTGGLVRAYSDAVKEVLRIVPKAEKVLTLRYMLAIPYSFLERVRILVAENQGEIQEEEFAGDITLTVRFREENAESFCLRIKDLTRGTVEAIFIDSDSNTILPIPIQ
jgi:uncharacterized YigZ family protein